MRFAGLILICLLLCGCQTATQKRAEAISVGVHSVNMSLKVHRLDLAVKYSEELTKIVPKPKKAIDIKAVTKKDVNGKVVKYAVLPPGFDLNISPLVVDSPEYVRFLLENEGFKKQLENDNKLFGNFETKVDDAIRATIKESEATPKKKFPWWKTIFGITGIGLVVACVAFPGFGVAAMGILSGVGRFFVLAVGFVSDALIYIFRKK